MMQLPVVCTLTPETMATRRAQLLPGLFGRAQAFEATADGYRLRFDASAEMFHAVAGTAIVLMLVMIGLHLKGHGPRAH